MGVFVGPDVSENGLVLALDAGNRKSYPGSGATWTDLSGRGNNGTLTNGPTYSSSNGGSIVFDGANNYVTLGTPSLLNQVQVPLTICAWVKLNTISGFFSIWSAYKETSSSQLYSLLRVDNGIVRYFASTSSGGFQYQDSFNVSSGIWYFYSVVVSGTISFPVVNVYLNNFSQSFSYSALSSTPNNAVEFRIGANQYSLSPEWLNGNISQVSWYNRALTASEIKQNYNATKGRYGL